MTRPISATFRSPTRPSACISVHHFGIAGEPIEHVLAATLGIDEARAPKDLQVARRVGEGQIGPRGKLLDAAHALGEVLQQFQPVSVAERLRHLGEACKDRLFRSGA